VPGTFKPKPGPKKPFIRRLVFDFFARCSTNSYAAPHYTNCALHSSFGIMEHANQAKRRAGSTKPVPFTVSFYTPPSKFLKVLIQKEGQFGRYLRNFYVKIRHMRAR